MQKCKSALAASVFVLVAGAAVHGTFAQEHGHTQTAGAKHVMFTPDQLKWGPAPPSLPPGAQMAVVSGDPAGKGQFVLRAKFPDGYRVPPHWHPTEENVTVLSGTLLMATGDKFDAASMKPLGAGSYSNIGPNVRHYVMAKGETTIQVHGMGPFTVTYVNPNDDPRKKAGTQ